MIISIHDNVLSNDFGLTIQVLFLKKVENIVPFSAAHSKPSIRYILMTYYLIINPETLLKLVERIVKVL
jgi:hypothetical protein